MIIKTPNISYKDLFKACQFYGQKEDRDYIYPAAITKLQNNFGNAIIMAEAVSDLLKVWHLNFYRFGMFSPTAIEQCVKTKSDLIHKYALLNRKSEHKILSKLCDAILKGMQILQVDA